MMELTHEERMFLESCPIDVTYPSPDADIAERLIPRGFLQTITTMRGEQKGCLN